MELIEATALAQAEGDAKYEPGDWKEKGKDEFVDRLSHAIAHLMNAAWDDAESVETHLGHAAADIGHVLWAIKRGIITKQDLQNAAMILT